MVDIGCAIRCCGFTFLSCRRFIVSFARLYLPHITWQAHGCTIKQCGLHFSSKHKSTGGASSLACNASRTEWPAEGCFIGHLSFLSSRSVGPQSSLEQTSDEGLVVLSLAPGLIVPCFDHSCHSLFCDKLILKALCLDLPPQSCPNE